MKVWVTSSAMMFEIGIASGHWENLSIQESKYVSISMSMRRSKRSMWRISNVQAVGTVFTMRCWILEHCHGMQACVYWDTSALLQYQTYQLVMRWHVALIPGCERPCSEPKNLVSLTGWDKWMNTCGDISTFIESKRTVGGDCVVRVCESSFWVIAVAEKAIVGGCPLIRAFLLLCESASVIMLGCVEGPWYVTKLSWQACWGEWQSGQEFKV